MKVYNDRFIIQTNVSPIMFHAQKGELVDEINQAAFYIDKERAEEDLKMYADKPDLQCHITACKITYDF